MKIFHKKTGLTQRSSKIVLEGKSEKTIVKSVSDAVRDTIIENNNHKKKRLKQKDLPSKEDDVKNYDDRIEKDMTKLTNLINKGITMQMPDIIKVQVKVGKYNTNRKVPRPLSVVFKEKFESNKVVRNASNL